MGRGRTWHGVGLTWARAPGRLSSRSASCRWRRSARPSRPMCRRRQAPMSLTILRMAQCVEQTVCSNVCPSLSWHPEKLSGVLLSASLQASLSSTGCRMAGAGDDCGEPAGGEGGAVGAAHSLQGHPGAFSGWGLGGLGQLQNSLTRPMSEGVRVATFHSSCAACMSRLGWDCFRSVSSKCSSLWCQRGC